MDRYWLAGWQEGHLARNAKPPVGRCEVIPLRPELLPITGAVSDSRARTIDPRRYERRAPKIGAGVILLALSLAGWGLTIALLWAIKTGAAVLWRSLFLLVIALLVGASLAWASVAAVEAALLRWAM
jgi:hypothetical protein